MDAVVGLFNQVRERIKAAGGIEPKTRDWGTAADSLFSRGLSSSDILKALDVGLSDNFHRPRLMDLGLVYLERNYARITQVYTPGTAKLRVVKMTANMRRLWEIELHKWEHDYERKHGGKPTGKERNDELTRICNRIVEFDDCVDYRCTEPACTKPGMEWGTIDQRALPPRIRADKLQEQATMAALKALEDTA